MDQSLRDLIATTRKASAARTLSIAGFFAILITFPIIFSSSQEQQTINQYAQTPNPTLPISEPAPSVLSPAETSATVKAALATSPLHIYSSNNVGDSGA